MNIKAHIVDHPQGSEAWLQHRARSLNASDLAAAMGLSKYMTRTELIARIATGIVPEVDAATQRRFDDGHAAEAAARPWAEEIIADTLYPTVLAAEVDGLPLSASLDGQDLTPFSTFEHKQANAELIASLEAGAIPVQYHSQMEQGLMLSGATRCLFMASNGTRESMRFAWYESSPELRAKIIPTWKQVMADVAAYIPTAAVAPVVAAPVQALPAVSVQVTGSIAVIDNFATFEVAVRDFLEHRLIRQPKTDQDFADLDVQIKAMKGAEAALDAAENQMLAQISAVDTAKKAKDMLAKLVRDNRLMAEKLLASEKERRRAEIVSGGTNALREHIDSLNQRLARPYMPTIAADFVGCIRGKKSLASMEDAVATELARAKIEASRIADLIQANLATLVELASEHKALFPDTTQLVLKAADDCRAVIVSRIAEHQAAEQARAAALAEKERERIRVEEAAKLQREAEARQRAEKLEEERLAGEAQASAYVASVVQQATTPSLALVDVLKAPVAQAESGARIKLGDINARLSPLSLTADGLAQIGFAHVATDKSAKLYRESDFPAICRALISRIERAALPSRQVA